MDSIVARRVLRAVFLKGQVIRSYFLYTNSCDTGCYFYSRFWYRYRWIWDQSGAIVDFATGEFVGERLKIATPQPATPEKVAEVVRTLVE